MCNYIDQLPLELETLLLEQLSHDTLKNMCLVNKYYKSLAAPLVWGTFDSDLSETNKDRLDMVLTNNLVELVANLRALCIRKSSTTSSEAWNLSLQQLSNAIVVNSLDKVIVTDAVDSRNLGLLIMRQKKMVELSIPVMKSQGPPGRPFVQGNLTLLERLTIFPNADQTGYGVWLENMPALKKLTVRGNQASQASLFVPWKIRPKLGHLNSLYLENMTLTTGAGKIDKWIVREGATLRTLVIRDCKGIESFFKDLRSTHVDDEGESTLTHLSVTENCDTRWMYHLTEFIYTCSGLHYLYLSSSRGELPDVDPMGSQKFTLKVLLIDKQNDWGKAETAKEVPAGKLRDLLLYLAESYRVIEELGVSLQWVDFDEWEFNTPWLSDRAADSSITKTIVEQLDAIARFPHLRVLRLTQPPIVLVDEEQTDPRIGAYHQRQWRYQQFAEQILQRLAKKASGIQLLAFSPTRLHGDEFLLEDGNGHRWPHYYYLRGETRIALPGGKHAIKVHAMPVKKDKIEHYMPWPRVSDDP